MLHIFNCFNKNYQLLVYYYYYLCFIFNLNLTYSMPTFDRFIENVTVIIGNNAILPCYINNIGDHKVCKNLNFILFFILFTANQSISAKI